MKVRYFIFLTLMIGIISEFIHPEMETWVPVSIVAYIICGGLIALAVYFRKKNKAQEALNSIIGAFIVYAEYAVITSIAYLRMIDTISTESLVSIVVTIVVIIVFAVIAFWDDVKRLIHIS